MLWDNAGREDNRVQSRKKSIAMNTSPYRHDGSTRGFCTTDPERQGVLAGVARMAAVQAQVNQITRRFAHARASDASRPQPSAPTSFQRSGQALNG